MSEPTITELERELAQREESAQTVLSLVTPALEELKKAREALETAAAQYVTRTEVQETYVEGITKVVNKRFDEMDEAGVQRHGQLVRQMEERFALTATKEELSGVQLAGSENTTRIAKIEASEETWRAAIEARIVRLESGQKKQAENIQKISDHTAAIANSVQAMEQTYSAALRGMTDNLDTFISTQRERAENQQSSIIEVKTKTDVLSREVAFVKTTQSDAEQRYNTSFKPVYDFIMGSPTQEPIKTVIGNLAGEISILRGSMSNQAAEIGLVAGYVKTQQAAEENRRNFWQRVRLQMATPRGVMALMALVLFIFMVLNAFSLDQLIMRIQQGGELLGVLFGAKPR